MNSSFKQITKYKKKVVTAKHNSKEITAKRDQQNNKR